MRMMQEKIINLLTLFTSVGTLLCCALPALVAAVAGGAAVVSLVSAFPWLAAVSERKCWIFLIAGALIIFSGILHFRPKGTLACAISGGKGCATASAFGKAAFWLSFVIYVIGVFMAYGIVPMMEWLKG